MVKLSIIIPYFETYDLTLKLLRELAIQKTNEVEIILIDDYCKQEFSKTKCEGIDEVFIHSPITVINHVENQGVAKSRNEGIDKAEGKYITFIDCDDMVTMDYIETLLKAIDTYDTDIINFNWYDMTQHIEVRKPDNPAPWKAIYKKGMIPIFREDIEFGGEDVYFQSDIQIGINDKNFSITYLDKLLYFYNSNREGSLFWKKTHQ